MASAKKKIVECSACRRIMKVCTDVETTSDADHLYVMSASNSLLPGLVKIGRSKNPLQRAIDLQESKPYHIKIHALFWGFGWRETDVLVRATGATRVSIDLTRAVFRHAEAQAKPS